MDCNVFRFFQIFFKVEAVLSYNGNVFFNILYPANGNGFSAYENIIILVRAILLLLQIISAIMRQWQFFWSTGNVYFNEILHSGQWKRVYCLLETALFYSEFFLLVQTIIETQGKSIFKDEIYYCQSTPVFMIVSAILRFLKVEVTFLYSGNAFFNEPFIRLVETDFLSRGNSAFCSELFFCQWKPLLELGGRGSFQRKSLLLLVDK